MPHHAWSSQKSWFGSSISKPVWISKWRSAISIYNHSSLCTTFGTYNRLPQPSRRKSACEKLTYALFHTWSIPKLRFGFTTGQSLFIKESEGVLSWYTLTQVYTQSLEYIKYYCILLGGMDSYFKTLSGEKMKGQDINMLSLKFLHIL